MRTSIYSPMDIGRYVEQANENFSGADGYGADGYGADGYGADGYGADGYGADGYNFIPENQMDLSAEGYANAAGKQIPVGAESSPYVVNIATSNSSTSGTAIVYGFNVYGFAANNGSTTGITVTSGIASTTYTQMLNQSFSQPFQTRFIRVAASSYTQLTQVITVTSVDANGETCTKPLITQSGFDPYQYQSTVLNFPCDVYIDGNTYFSIPILAGVAGNVFTMYIFPAMKVNAARALEGAPQAKFYRSAEVGRYKTAVNSKFAQMRKAALPAKRPIAR